MNFAPVVPSGGLAGWAFLGATFENQRAAFDAGPRITRDTTYFETRIASVESAEALVADRRLLRVALGAFGLQEDLDNRFFVRRVLEGGAQSRDALANRLTDDRYRQFAAAFGFDRSEGPRSAEPGFATSITEAYRARRFEAAVGESEQSLRLAMNARRALPGIAGSESAETTKWLQIMGTPPLREVFETALGLPDGFGRLDLERQVETFRDRAERQLGVESLSALRDEAVLERVVRRFLLREQVEAFNATATAGSIALTLLQSARGAG